MKIEINRMECYARHGVLPLENKVGAPFRVSLTLFVPDAACAGALRDDRLEDTVNYAEAAALVRREMAQPSQLIEHVAGRIAAAVLKTFRKVNEVTVKVEKLSPPIAGFSAEGVSVEHTAQRSLFIFDFDGTIADTRAGIVRTMQASFRAMHLPVPEAEEIVPTIGLPLTESIARLGDLQGEMLEQTVETYHRLFEEVGVEGIILYDGMKEWLEALHRDGVILAIATSRGHDSTERLCQRLGIRPLFTEIVACDDVLRAKPHPEAVERLMRRCAVTAEATTVVGDTTFDIEMGRRAGCHTIGVTWGNHSEQMLRQAGAEEIRVKKAKRVEKVEK